MRLLLFTVITVAVLLRIGLVLSTAGLEIYTGDNRRYAALATSLSDGAGFAWGPNQPTSFRPPLYPLFIAFVWTLAGEKSLEAVRWVQILLALSSVLLLYHIGRRCFDERTALLASAGLAVYPSFLFFGVLLMTEVLFVTLLLLFILCFERLHQGPTLALAAGTGGALGLAALTRSVMWPFIVVLAVLVWLTVPVGRRRRIFLVAAVIIGYATVVGPWSARNTSLQGTFTVVDTMGGVNLMIGNYAHTPEERMWEPRGLRGDKAWASSLPPTAPDGATWTEGKKEKWALRQAVAFMADHPITTLRRAVLKFADFWGLERDFIAGVRRGHYNPPAWITMAGAATITLAYVAVALVAAIGVFLSPPQSGAHVFLLTLVLFVCGVHTVVFGHSRYHLPLIPILLLYAAAAVTSGQWRQLFARRWRAGLALATVLMLCTIWSRELIFRDWDRIRQLAAGSRSLF